MQADDRPLMDDDWFPCLTEDGLRWFPREALADIPVIDGSAIWRATHKATPSQPDAEGETPDG